MKEYNTIGSFRGVNINVILNDTEIIYDGEVDEAPIEIKNLKYYDVKMGNIISLYVHSD